MHLSDNMVTCAANGHAAAELASDDQLRFSEITDDVTSSKPPPAEKRLISGAERDFTHKNDQCRPSAH